jgi:release factor glutamine methyltransferase
VKEIRRTAAERLRAAGIESPRADARILFEHANGEVSEFESLIQRRLAHEPTAYIVGHKEFWSLDFQVGPGVLIPRPDTETIVEVALRDLPDRRQPYRVLDVGTGSGCLLIALLKEFPNATGIGIDDSEAALSWAHRNVIAFAMSHRCELSKMNWADAPGGYDLIVSNPPYVATADLARLQPEVGAFEPREALDGGPDGLGTYRRIAPVLKVNLKAEGLALLEIGAGQHQMVTQIMESQGLTVLRIEPDLAGIPRCVVLRGSAGDR